MLRFLNSNAPFKNGIRFRLGADDFLLVFRENSKKNKVESAHVSETRQKGADV